ncbi:uncharacterized protein NECHADRAFT_82248 [Fusarium vanettenii 77-13-4]|uniref:Uncharacterized protein n=1 Tax=Fusarium vanettenii (strain ATCC MYA-4622 / CBS 123669 / FGSC 9596 / NRRL 45880 / 77-13-4) TaxID=660122 RepID=C7ZNI7_FUSV7|nr:uncharacterized protein NECHADRAFT_82248 [Fusarium vanettenii 77-13-4]EEU34402.1 predicted protein [Fusarium vanettenii 77-13-4]
MSVPADQTQPHIQGQGSARSSWISVDGNTREDFLRVTSTGSQQIILRHDAPENHTGTSDGNAGDDVTPPTTLDHIHGHVGGNRYGTALPSTLQLLDTSAVVEPLALYVEHATTGSVCEPLAMPSVHISQSVGEASLPAFGQKRQNSGGEEHQLESKKPRSEDQHNSTPPGKDAASSSGGNGTLNPNEKATLTEKYACFFYKICPEQCTGFTLLRWSAVLQHLLRSKGISGSPDEIRWKKAWSIMWPELEIPRNPHFEKLVDIQRREAMQPVLKYLKEAGVPVRNLESHAAALIDIVLCIPTPTPRAVGGEAVPAEGVQGLPATASAPAASPPLQPNASVQASQGVSGIVMPPPGQQMVFGHHPQTLPAFAAVHG